MTPTQNAINPPEMIEKNMTEVDLRDLKSINQTPSKKSSLPKRSLSAYRDNVSEKSGTSYIKVSHSKKIQSLE